MKVSLSISVDNEDLRKLRHFCDLTGLPVSRLFEDHVRVIVGTYDASGLDHKQKLSKLDLLRIFKNGAMQEI